MDRFCCDLPLRLLPGVISLILLIACGNTHQFADTSRERSAPVIPDSSPPVQSESDALPELPAEIPPTNPPETPSEPVVGVADPGGMVEARFPPGEPAEGSLLVRGSAAVATEEVVLRENTVQQSQTFRQTSRPWQTRQWQQGTPADRHRRAVRQVDHGVVDIVLVLDNSISMGDEQANLAARLAPLVEKIDGADWRIGLVTTDPSRPCLERVFYHDDPDVEQVYEQTILDVGTRLTTNERGLLKAVAAMGCRIDHKDGAGRPGAAQSWIRPDSNIAVLFVSDEDNCSTGRSGCPSDPDHDPAWLLSYMQKELARTPGENARVYGIYDLPVPGAGDPATCPSARHTGRVYDELVAATGGLAGSICGDAASGDYTRILSRISADMLTTLVSRVELPGIPGPGSLTITIDGIPAQGWRLEGGTVLFDTPPAPHALIELSWETGTDTMQERFALGADPDTDGLRVEVQGQPVDAASYRVEGQELVFQQPPPPGTTVACHYRPRTGLATDFTLAEDGSVVQSVAVDGVTVDPGPGLIISGRSLQLVPPPSDGSVILVQYARTSPVLEYPLNPLPADVRGRRLTDADRPGVDVDGVIQDDRLIIPAGEFRSGRRLLLILETGDAGGQFFELPVDPLDGSVEMEWVTGPACGQDPPVVRGRVVDVGCLPDADAQIRFTYRHAPPPADSFAVDGVPDPDRAEWSVLLDGEPLAGWTRDGATIYPGADRDPAAVVTIRAVW